MIIAYLTVHMTIYGSTRAFMRASQKMREFDFRLGHYNYHTPVIWYYVLTSINFRMALPTLSNWVKCIWRFSLCVFIVRYGFFFFSRVEWLIHVNKKFQITHFNWILLEPIMAIGFANARIWYKNNKNSLSIDKLTKWKKNSICCIDHTLLI